MSIMQKKALSCTLGLAIAGLSLIVYAGPCYVNTSTVLSASQKGCTEIWFGPDGLLCPGMTSLEGNGPFTSCAFRTIENTFNTGTSGNERSGRMEQGNVPRVCYSYLYCTLDGPRWVWFNFPVLGGMRYICEPFDSVDGNATANSFEAKGAHCSEPGE
jgi:hypothetical protein